MKLQIDFGNSRLKWRILGENEVVESGQIESTAIESGLRSLPWVVIKAVQICSVGDRGLTAGLAVLCDNYSSPDTRVQEVSNYDLPQWFSLGKTDKFQIGRDRVMAMLGAFSPGSCFCVIDAGTALTADYVDSGVHKGGYIVPGLELARDALEFKTARIGSVDSQLYSAKFEPGLTTQCAVEHGLRLALISLCQRVIDKSPIQIDKVFLTGGDAEWLKVHLPGRVQLQEDLVFEGISRYFASL